MAAELGTSCRTVKRGLRAIRGRLVETADAGRTTSWAVRDVAGDRADRRTIRGPIPWPWWAVASRLPNPALRVGAVCWALSGRHGADGFPLAACEWTDPGLSRSAVGRGLRHLENAGLIVVDRRPGRPAVVTLRAVEGGTGKGESSGTNGTGGRHGREADP
jgi:hypothetical protein